MIMLVLVLTVALLGSCGFVAGLRPSRHDPPTRLVAVLILYSVPVGLAVCIELSGQWFAQLRRAFDPEGLVLAVTLCSWLRAELSCWCQRGAMPWAAHWITRVFGPERDSQKAASRRHFDSVAPPPRVARGSTRAT